MTVPDEITLHCSPKLLVQIGAAVAALGLALYLTDVLILLAVAMLLAAVMQPPLNWLARHGLPRGVGVSLLYLLLLALLALALYALVPGIVEQASQIANGSWAAWLDQMTMQWQQETARYPGLTPLLELPVQMGAMVQNWMAGMGRWAINLSSLLMDGTLVLALAYFLAIDPNAPRRLLFDLLPEPYHLRAWYLSAHLGQQVVRWTWSQGLLALYIAVAFGVGLYLLGVPYALLLGLVGGVLEVIPFLGGAVTMLAAVLVSLPHSWNMALGAVAWYIVVNLVEGYVLVPRLYQRTLRLHPLLVLIAFVAGGRLLGLAGALLAVPLAAAIQAAWQHRDRVIAVPEQEGEAVAQDPVCGMRLTPELAACKQIYRGQTYFFCSERCHDLFLTWPVDPVCRQKVRPEVAEQVTYQGKIYYLCSPDCARRFAEAPASWLEPTSGPAQDKEARPIPALKPPG
ncbi:AI-2E family transporter [Litorilinea aerophila]|nr:AI-2E family transporter [Litorilinea aerophila]OUC06767.1 hypothetical protein RY27_18965 [Litorilinea aerophila]